MVEELGSLRPSVVRRDNVPEAAALSVEAAEAAQLAAKIALNEAKALEDGEIKAAKLAISERHAPAIKIARDAHNAAYNAVIAAKDAHLPDHPWEGRRVYRVVSSGSWGRQTKRVSGIVETVRSTSAFPENTSSYGRPALGSAIVRGVKKDGSASLRFDRMNDSWKLDTVADVAPALQATGRE